MRQHLLQSQQTLHLGAELSLTSLPLAVLNRGERILADQTGGVDNAVDGAKALAGRLKNAFHLICIGHIRCNYLNFSAGPPKL